MAKFMKAKPQQAYLKMSLYGPPGSGKTFTTLLMAEGLAKHRDRRVAYVDTERGTDFYAQQVDTRPIHPAAFDFDAIYTRSIAEITQEVKELSPDEYGVIIIDSISHLWESAMEAYTGRRTKIDSIPMHAWGKIKKPYKDLIKFLIAAPFDVFILGRQKNVFYNDENGEMIKEGVTMRAEGETAYEPHICTRLEAQVNPDDSTQSRYIAYVEKDRTGVISGSTICNPSFETIKPLLPLLGVSQAPAEDEDERIAKDSEMLDKIDESKTDKSVTLFHEFQAKLVDAKSAAGTGLIGEEIRKAKRYLLEEHATALRGLYKTYSERF